jgi:hypothetical protein
MPRKLKQEEIYRAKINWKLERSLA